MIGPVDEISSVAIDLPLDVALGKCSQYSDALRLSYSTMFPPFWISENNRRWISSDMYLRSVSKIIENPKLILSLISG